jgi:hypothetical protein
LDIGLNEKRLCVVSLDVEADFFNPSTAIGVQRLQEVMEVLDGHDVRTTLFVTGDVLNEFPGKILAHADRHEIATHGQAHEPLQGRDVSSRESELEDCISLWRSVLGTHPTGFRAPSHWFDTTQLNLLAKHGFRYDSSVVPRYPLRGRVWKYVGFRGLAPEEPYFADPRDPRKDGDGPILEIPVTPGPGNVPFSGTWIRMQGSTLPSLLGTLTNQTFLHLTFHSWDHVAFPGLWGIRSGPPFLRALDRILTALESRFGFVSCGDVLTRAWRERNGERVDEQPPT